VLLLINESRRDNELRYCVTLYVRIDAWVAALHKVREKYMHAGLSGDDVNRHELGRN